MRRFFRFRNFSHLIAPLLYFLVEVRSRVDISRTGKCRSVQNLRRLTNAIHKDNTPTISLFIFHWKDVPSHDEDRWYLTHLNRPHRTSIYSAFLRSSSPSKKHLSKGVIGRQVDGYIPPFHDTQRRNLTVSLNFDGFSLVDCPWSALFGSPVTYISKTQ